MCPKFRLSRHPPSASFLLSRILSSFILTVICSGEYLVKRLSHSLVEAAQHNHSLIFNGAAGVKGLAQEPSMVVMQVQAQGFEPATLLAHALTFSNP